MRFGKLLSRVIWKVIIKLNSAKSIFFCNTTKHNHSHVTNHIHYFDFNIADLILTDDQLIQYALADQL